MTVEEYKQAAARGECIEGGSEKHLLMHSEARRAMKITCEINSGYHTPEELRALMSELVGYEVDKSFGLFPPLCLSWWAMRWIKVSGCSRPYIPTSERT